MALLQSEPAIDGLSLEGDEATGANIVRVSLSAPAKQIAFNAGLEPGVVADKVSNLPAGHGLNAATNEYEDLLAAGINDPVKVTRSALQNAASIAALFLTTEAVVADKILNSPKGTGLNAATGAYEDLLAAGINDPVKVTRSALQNAASIAALFLTTEAVVADKPEKAAAPAGDPTGGMGGMDF